MDEADNHKQFLSFFLGKEIYGIPLEECKEVDHNKKILKIPCAPTYIEGIVNLRGDVVTILNLQNLFGKQSNPDKDKYSIIRLKGKKQAFAILADEVSDIIEVSEKNFEPCPSHLDEKEGRYIRNVAVFKGETLIVLNHEELLHLEDA
ncbi:CheW-like protein [Leptospira fainei serovar Hurstbridge str. BUT 6]|uniref:CheW-like protein n=1 Tax=Leptospira fainei serovar Hurstbridge str. BUT 6 TaxID=1193011 RepID=S3UY37_9LEPT|nr:chemotaxis protein CheW [Leptospira fainei]EPG75336.1 CheW-like protein [Leptospira fainei serovar Hurstbridge str. BUT 6]